MKQTLKPYLMTVALFATVIFYGLAQSISPITRFHSTNSPYTQYNDQFLSGFLQTSSVLNSRNGFLQLPFVGDPLLVYVGEKDSTQFMAYASGYRFEQRDTLQNIYKVDLTRYGIHAMVREEPAYCVQEYTFPDTVASKGFLLDIDHALSGSANEDMDVVFVDRRTIRAYKRSSQPDGHTPSLYYVARFSHPFHQWNVRREVVRTENGQREMRCKAAFVFDLKPSEVLTVTSAVSATSTDQAYACLNLPGAKLHVSDKRKPASASASPEKQTEQRSPAEQRTPTDQRTPASQRPLLAQSKVASTTKRSSSNPARTSPAKDRTPQSSTDFIEVTTREAELQAAFTAAMNLLRQRSECRRATNALDFFQAAFPLYLQSERISSVDAATTDSLLRNYAQSLFTGKQANTSASQAAWFVFNALGLTPIATSASEQQVASVTTTVNYRLVRPLFNVATLHMPRGRRFIIHTKNNSPRNLRILSAQLTHQPLSSEATITTEQLQKSGVLEVKMGK